MKTNFALSLLDLWLVLGLGACCYLGAVFRLYKKCLLIKKNEQFNIFFLSFFPFAKINIPIKKVTQDFVSTL